MYKYILIFILLFVFSCANMNRNYWKESNCRNKIERHYDAKGKYTGSSWTTVCD